MKKKIERKIKKTVLFLYEVKADKINSIIKSTFKFDKKPEVNTATKIFKTLFAKGPQLLKL